MSQWQEHFGLPPGFERHTVIDATTGRVVLDRAPAAEFDRWYDHHAFWHEPRAIEEVLQDLRSAYLGRHDLDADETRRHYLIND